MDDLDKSLPGAEAMVDAEQSTPKINHNENCLNCGTKLQDVFCHHCGQKDLPQRQTLAELWTNFISSFWSYEGKFFLTTRYLITRPGYLAMEYNAGRRESYYHPARMYVFISFVFFLIFFSLPEGKDNVELSDEDKEELSNTNRKVNKTLAAAGADTLAAISDPVRTKADSSITVVKKKKNRFNVGISKADYETLKSYDSAQTLLTESERDNWFERKLTKRSIELNQKYKDDVSGFGRDFWKAALDNFSKVLFFLLPVFALLLKLLYVRKGHFYSEHLVFSIYYYNFFYFAGSVMMLVGLVPALGWLSTLIGFVIYFYLLLAMKRMYGQRWGKTVAKFLIFSFVFMICFAFGFLINLFVIVMLL